MEHGWGLTYLAPRDSFEMGVGKDWAHFIFLANVAHGHYFRSDSPSSGG